MFNGTVVSIHISPKAELPLSTVGQVRAVPGKGLEGDRYFNQTGTYSKKVGTDRQVTLIEAEALQALSRDYGIVIEPHETRRNIVTRETPLNHLVGQEFLVGNIRLRGVRLCEPCMHLEKLTRQGVMKGLIHRGGLRAEILTEGVILAGDTIRMA